MQSFDPMWNQESLIYPHYTILFKASLNGPVTKISLSSCLPLYGLYLIQVISAASGCIIGNNHAKLDL